MTQYHSHGVTLSDNQTAKLAKAFRDKSAITLRLSNHELSGNDELMLTNTQLLKKFQKAIASDKAIDVKISKTQIHHVARKGGSLFGTLVSFAQNCFPWQQILPRRYFWGLQLVN